MKTTAYTHFQNGDYGDLEKAHLERDEDKYNSNKDIDQHKSKLNTKHVFVEDMDVYYHENYIKPIEEYNERQTRKSRKIESYQAYKDKKSEERYEKSFKSKKRHLEKKESEKNPDEREEISDEYVKGLIDSRQSFELNEQRLMIMNLSNKKDIKKLKMMMAKKIGLSEDEALETFGRGIHNSAVRFNNDYKYLQITEGHIHLDESAPHGHYNVYTKGQDEKGMPLVDLYDGLKMEFGKFRTDKDGSDKTYKKSGKKQYKSNGELLAEFRDKNDNMIIYEIKKEIQKTARERGVELEDDFLELHRIDPPKDRIGRDMEEYKREQEQEKIDKANMELDDTVYSLDKRQMELSKREREVKVREESLEEREQAIQAREKVSEDWEEELRKKHYEQVERDDELVKKSAVINDFQERYNRLLEKEKAHDKYVVEIDAHMKNDTKVGANLREAGRTNSKFKESYRNMLKTQTNKNLSYKTKDDGPVK